MNKILTEYGQLSENRCCHVLQIHCVDCPASFFCKPSCFPILLATAQFIKTVSTNRAVHFMVRSIYWICCMSVTSCHWNSLLENFDSELQLINASLVWSPVSLSGRGEKLLERNKFPGHNLRQYGNMLNQNSLYQY